MLRRRSPPPSRAAERVTEYLDLVRSAQDKQGAAKRYDFYKKTMNEAQANRMIGYLKDNGLIEGDNENGYRITGKGETWHEILKKHRDLVGLLTRELSGDRIKRW